MYAAQAFNQDISNWNVRCYICALMVVLVNYSRVPSGINITFKVNIGGVDIDYVVLIAAGVGAVIVPDARV